MTLACPGVAPSTVRTWRCAPGSARPGWEVTNAVLMHLSAVAAKVLPESDQDGQGLAEYALILGLIAMVAIVALIFLGNQISDKLSVIGNSIGNTVP